LGKFKDSPHQGKIFLVIQVSVDNHVILACGTKSGGRLPVETMNSLLTIARKNNKP